MYYLGIDVGSITTKAVIIDDAGELCAAQVVKTGAQQKKALADAVSAAYEEAKVSASDIIYTVATGYGRKNVPHADRVVTEITAHAYGVRHFFPDSRVIIDIGGQDTKVIGLMESGEVDDFVMNDKCAAGTGRFLEVMAQIIDVPLAEFGDRALKHTKGLTINSTCTVFAESEVISLISREETLEDIAYAIHSSVVDRIISLAKKIHQHGAVTLSGGVSKNSAIRTLIADRLKVEVHLSDNPQIIGALGAAILAQKGKN